MSYTLVLEWMPGDLYMSAVTARCTAPTSSYSVVWLPPNKVYQITLYCGSTSLVSFLVGAFRGKAWSYMKQKKEKRITLRLTPEQYEAIQSKAEIAQMSIGAYVRAAALRHRVVVVDGLKELTHELKGIGRNLNQLVVLSNMGKIQDVYLGETMEALGQIYRQLRELAEQEKR